MTTTSLDNQMTPSFESDDLIRDMVYGKKGQNRRMYCAATVGSTVMAAALFRVLGQDYAELPLAASVIG